MDDTCQRMQKQIKTDQRALSVALGSLTNLLINLSIKRKLDNFINNSRKCNDCTSFVEISSKGNHQSSESTAPFVGLAQVQEGVG